MSTNYSKMNGHTNSQNSNGTARKANEGLNRTHEGHNKTNEGLNKTNEGHNRTAEWRNKSDGRNGTVQDREDDAWARQFLPPPLVLGDTERAKQVEEALSGLVLDGHILRRVAAVFSRELTEGLQRRPSSLQMENTYVPDLPNGTEEGVFLALDLGGTNFRMLLLELRQGALHRERVHHYHISDELRLGPGTDLFNFLADCVLDFVKDEGVEDQKLSLGFTFSFPMRQHSISSGELITWTKSFNCGGMEGVDVAALLQRCLDARNLQVTVQVLLNDTTGTLVSAAQEFRHAAIGAILGTGSNGCYIESAHECSWETRHDDTGHVIVDVEWGAFGDNGCLSFLRTDMDQQVDDESLLTRSFTFEKYIGGKFLGCLCRAALCRLAARGLFPAAPPPRTITSACLSAFEAEQETGDVSATGAALSAALGRVVSPDDARVAQHACRLLSTRAAMLVSVCISELLRRMKSTGVSPPVVGVAIDGSVYKKHPTIKSLMQRYIELLAPGHPFELLSAEDGSGKGSALTAAIAQRLAVDS